MTSKDVRQFTVMAKLPKFPVGLTPDQIKAIYTLPKNGGHGTIAIVDVGADTTIESDLAAFDTQFNLPACTTSNKCFEKHMMDTTAKDQGGV